MANKIEEVDVAKLMSDVDRLRAQRNGLLDVVKFILSHIDDEKIGNEIATRANAVLQNQPRVDRVLH